MSERYNGNRRNTDNEDTMYIPSDIGDQQNYPAPDYPGNYQQPQQQYYQNNGTQQGYYSSAEQNPFAANQQNPFAQQNQQQQYYQNGYQQQQQQQYYQNQYQQPQQQQYYQNPYQQQPQQQYYQNQPQNYPPPPAPPKQKKKKKRHKSFIGKIIRRVIFSLLSLGLLLFGIYSCTSYSLIKQVNYKPTGERYRTEGALSKSYVKSVLVIGTDGLSADERGRSDSMILVSMNSKKNELTLTSFMRDCYVEIPNYGWNRLNAAYSFGGAELLMDTIELNFNIRIDDYISVNFGAFSSVVDSVDGVEVEMSDEEAQAVDIILISQLNELMGDAQDSDLLYAGGKHLLNGKQALAYSRVRNVGNNDFERTERQRRVFTKILEKAKKHGITFIKKAADKAFPHLTTNMTSKDMYLLSLRVPFLLKYKRNQIQIPAEGTYSGVTVDEMAVLEIDRQANYELIKDQVFSDK